jgi:hypothetical protein
MARRAPSAVTPLLDYEFRGETSPSPLHRSRRNAMLQGKSEARNPKSETNSKFEIESTKRRTLVSSFENSIFRLVSDFELRISDLFRVSDFELRISAVTHAPDQNQA